jgi:hypothetical protein
MQREVRIMDSDWNKIPIYQILNYEATNAGDMGRLDRIMQHR